LAYYKAFIELLDAVKDVCVHFRVPAKFTFDISTENEYNARLLYKGTREDSPDMIEWFHPEISFAPAKDSARLQVADLLAYEAMKGIDHATGPILRKRRSWEALAKTDRFHIIGYGMEWFEDTKRNMPKLEEKSGFNQQDYQQWLKDRNRQHSSSNMIHFTNWIGERERRRNKPYKPHHLM
jgi:hypothetical protein